MRISISSHSTQPWKVHQLLNDFRIEDAWQLPISIKESDSIDDVLSTFVLAIGQIGKTGLAGQLFKLRNWLGRVFHWEEEALPRETVKPGLIKNRYAKLEKIAPENLPKGGFDHFNLVYQLPTESLLEIENKTVQAAVHFGKVKSENNYSAQMTIYVKPNGYFGQLYMLIIKPFRHFIVYPTLLKAVGKAWRCSH
ncbi:DUF2867 domain-containing protein [Reichenbachiella sp.]|uniref:DUF2867 domain-containing protein n=1 Tax=Reichenbachiella sp. TaxID=2184521 RepID=UPI0032980684